MDVSINLGLVIPVGIDVLAERTLRDHVDELAAPSVTALVGGEPVEQCLASGFLQIHIERGVDAEASLVNLVAAVFGFKIAADVFDVVRCERVRIFLQVEKRSACFWRPRPGRR